jgi:ribosomal protein L29
MKKIINELREKSLKELEKEKVDLYEEIAKYQVEKKINMQKDTHVMAKKKKKLALILTLLTEKKELESLNKKK